MSVISNDGGGGAGFVPDVATAGKLIFSDAVTRIVPGATSLSLRNTADSADNLIILDAGAATFRNTVNATTFVGALTGNASTATALATPRAINGTNFDGSAPITVTAAAGTLTGATLAANVLASSLTSVGILASPHFTSPVVDSGGISITGPNTLTGTVTAGGATLLTLSPAAHTGVTAETNAILVNSQTITIITAGFATQRFALFNQPTVSAGSALTVATAATVAIANAPTPGGSALITRPVALLVQNGQVGIDSNSGLSTATTANVGPAVAITGTWITGGSTTTNKPHFLIEPSGTTSTGWIGTSGTALGVNAATGFGGRLADFQVAGVTKFNIGAGGGFNATGGSNVQAPFTVNTGSNNLFTVTQGVANGFTSPYAMQVTGGAHIGSGIAELTDIIFNLARSVTFTTGAGTVANLRAFRITAPTYLAGTAATTFTQAATVSISGPPVASTNVVFTNQPAALQIESGLLLTALSATGGAGFRLPHGAAPTTPVNGDMWSTTAGLFIYINGVTKTVTLT